MIYILPYFQVTKMLVAIVVLFGVCWLPLHAFNLLWDLSQQFADFMSSPEGQPIANSLYLIFHWLAMANSFVNPFIYIFMLTSFRVCIILSTKNSQYLIGTREGERLFKKLRKLRRWKN